MAIDTPVEDLGIEEALVAYLAGEATIAALIGTRIYPGIAEPRTAFPYLTYQVITDVNEKTLEAAAGCAEASIQLKCWGKSGVQGRRQARQLYRAVRNVLHGFGPADMAGTWVHECWINDRSDQDENPEGGRSDGDACVTCDVMIAYDDSVPTF